MRLSLCLSVSLSPSLCVYVRVSGYPDNHSSFRYSSPCVPVIVVTSSHCHSKSAPGGPGKHRLRHGRPRTLKRGGTAPQQRRAG